MAGPPSWMIEWLADNGYRAEAATGLDIASRIDQPLGCGAFGCVFKTSDPRWVLKVTDDPDEGPLMASIIALRRKHGGGNGYGPNVHLPGIVFVRNLFQAFWDEEEPIYVIVREEVKPWESYDWHRMVYYDAEQVEVDGEKELLYADPVPAPPDIRGLTSMTIVQEYAKKFNRVESEKSKEAALLKYVEWLEIAGEELPLVSEAMLELFDNEIVLEDVHEANLGYARVNWGPKYRQPGRVIIHDVGMSETPFRPRFRHLNPVESDASFGIGRYTWMPLDQVLAWEPIAAELGVSKIARSKDGFTRAYEAATFPEGLSPYWLDKRERFIARHVAQAKANGEPWFRKGMPTRRHLALIMWGYSPQPSKLPRPGNRGRELRANPVPSPQEMDFYSEGACELFAYALAKVFGYTPVAMRYYFPDGSWTTPHVFAVTADDVAIDAGGSTTLEEIVAREWHVPQGAQDEPRLIKLTPAAALNELRSWPKEEVQDALAFVRRYVDFYRVGVANPVVPNPIKMWPWVSAAAAATGNYDITSHPDYDPVLRGILKDKYRDDFYIEAMEWTSNWMLPSKIEGAPTLKEARTAHRSDESDRRSIDGVIAWLKSDPATVIQDAPIVLDDRKELLDGWHRIAAWRMLGLSRQPIPVVYPKSNPVHDAPDWLRFAVQRAEPRIARLHGRQMLPESWDIFGCGGFGCVLPTRKPGWVCKVSIEGSEAFFARAQAKLDLYAPGVCRYLEPIKVETGKGPVWIMWRQAIEGENFRDWRDSHRTPPDLEAKIEALEWNEETSKSAFMRKFKAGQKLRADWEREQGTDAYEILEALQQQGLRVAATFSWFCENVDDRPYVFAKMLADRAEPAKAIFEPSHDRLYWHYTSKEIPRDDHLLDAAVGLLGYRYHLGQLRGHKLMGPLAAALKAYLDKGLLLADAQPDNIAMVGGVWTLFDAGFTVPVSTRWNAMWLDVDPQVDRWFGNKRWDMWNELRKVAASPGYVPNPLCR